MATAIFLRMIKGMLGRRSYVVVSARSIARLEECVAARINFGIELGQTFQERSDDELDQELLEAMEALTAEPDR